MWITIYLVCPVFFSSKIGFSRYSCVFREGKSATPLFRKVCNPPNLSVALYTSPLGVVAGFFSPSTGEPLTACLLHCALLANSVVMQFASRVPFPARAEKPVRSFDSAPFRCACSGRSGKISKVFSGRTGQGVQAPRGLMHSNAVQARRKGPLPLGLLAGAQCAAC